MLAFNNFIKHLRLSDVYLLIDKLLGYNIKLTAMKRNYLNDRATESRFSTASGIVLIIFFILFVITIIRFAVR
jgi:ABC-type sugar transport system permease subunit